MIGNILFRTIWMQNKFFFISSVSLLFSILIASVFLKDQFYYARSYNLRLFLYNILFLFQHHIIVYNNFYCHSYIFNTTFTKPMSYQQSNARYFYNNYANQTNQTNQIPTTITTSHLFDYNKYEPNKPNQSPNINSFNYGPQVLQYKNYQGYNYFRPNSFRKKQQKIKQNTYMMTQQPFNLASDFNKAQNSFYFQKSNQKYGSPINQFQIGSRLQGPSKLNTTSTQIPQIPQINQINQINQNNSQQIQMYPLKHKQIYVPSNPSTLTKKKNRQKYNIYSCLDEPLERFKKNGCKGMTCSANECVASTQRYDWM